MDTALPIISTIASLTDTIFNSLCKVVNLEQSVDSLKTELNELTEARKDLEIHINQEESLGLTSTNQAKGWLDRAVKAEAEVNLIIQYFEQQRRCFWCSNINCISRYKLSRKVQEKLKVINDLKEKKLMETSVVEGSIIAPVVEIPSRPAIGLDVMLEKVRLLLREEGVGIIGIYGMGGVGKTTLLKKINNELTRKLDLDVVIWASVSKDFVVDRIQKAIAVRLGLSWDDNEFPEQRAARIYRAMRKKKFMLLLDDVWEGVDLEKIGIPIPDKDNKCKLVFSTRSMDVCSDMDADRKIKVEFLKEEESWLLFHEKVGRSEILNSPPISLLAETIVRKCGGLPLALITIGRVMANKETEEEWRYAIEVLNRSPSELRGMEDVFALLKFSYDNLSSDTLKLCLVYCTLFPEDYSIEIEQLIEYWVGEGFLENFCGYSAHYMGHALVGSLKVACFLETGEEETQVKMHDVVRSFALWVVSECGENEMKFLVQASAGLIEAPSIEKWEVAHRISLWDNGITELPESPACPHLLTLLLQWNSGLSRISHGFFQFMPALRVLDVSLTSLREIPASICELVELRHLDLSGTKLNSLPKELGNLQKLRHLDLQRTFYLTTVPRHAIFGLSQLRVLNLYYSYGGWGVPEFQNENEVSFADLECLRHLNTLGITITESITLRRLSVSTTLLRCIQYLYITECEGLYFLQLSKTPGDGEKLRRLSVNNCCDLMYLTVGMEAGKNWLPTLEVLALFRLPSLSTVWRNSPIEGCLQNLRTINIWYCDKLKNVSWIFRLPKLEMVYLFYCKEMEEVVGGDQAVEEETKAFPRLRTISMRDLPALTSISQQAMAFPSLENIAVVNCPKLKKLPLKASDASTTLPTVYGEKEWWNKLVWNEASTASVFLPRFMAT